MTNRTAVILVNWNGWCDTIECIGSLLCQEAEDKHIVVVDNASDDGSVSKVEDWCRGILDTPIQSQIGEVPILQKAPKSLDWLTLSDSDSPPHKLPTLLIVKSKTNRGFAGGNNLGIFFARSSQTDFFWLLNTDTVVAPGALAALVSRATADPVIGITGSSLIYYWKPDRIQALGGASFNSQTGTSCHLGVGLSANNIPCDPTLVEAETDYVVGASMLVSSIFLDAIGPMCEDYFLYYEEIDWAVRGKGRFRLAYAPNSRVYHKVGGSSRKNASRLSLRYLYRNRLLFIARYFPNAYDAVVSHLGLQLLQNLRRLRWNDVIEIALALSARKSLKQKGMLDVQS